MRVPLRTSNFPADRLCVALAAPTPDELVHRMAMLPADTQLIEMRLDALRDPLASVGLLASSLAAWPDRTFLATCRTVASGGDFQGSAADELAVLLAAAEAGFAWVDLAVESAEVLGPSALDELRAVGARVLLSWHDFQGMGDVAGARAQMRALAPDLTKVVPTAWSLSDSLDLLQWLQRKGQQSPPMLAMAMGEAGALTRILGPSAGSAFTFAAPSADAATAPGQMTAESLTRLYRVAAISARTRRFGIAGDPVRSSLSPLMFNTVFAAGGHDAVYLPLLTREPEVLFRAAGELPLEGFSVTMPLKQTILPFLAEIDPLAARIGAVNTVRRTSAGAFYGENTDVLGVVRPLEARISLQGARVLVLGAGGAARAVVFGCADRGARVVVANRSAERAEALAHEAGCAAMPMERLTEERFDVLIQATPAGMAGNPAALPLSEDQLRADLVFDLVYNPAETPLLAMARRRGLATIPGLEMFLHQGARQYELWMEEPAPMELMRTTVQEALGALAR